MHAATADAPQDNGQTLSQAFNTTTKYAPRALIHVDLKKYSKDDEYAKSSTQHVLRDSTHSAPNVAYTMARTPGAVLTGFAEDGTSTHGDDAAEWVVMTSEVPLDKMTRQPNHGTYALNTAHMWALDPNTNLVSVYHGPVMVNVVDTATDNGLSTLQKCQNMHRAKPDDWPGSATPAVPEVLSVVSTGLTEMTEC